MGHFDFDCLICGGDQDNIKRNGYFGGFDCIKKNYNNGECSFCEGCVWRKNHTVGDFISFFYSVQGWNKKLEQLEKCKRFCNYEISSLLKVERYIPYFSFCLFYETKSTNKIETFYWFLFSRINFSRFYGEKEKKHFSTLHQELINKQLDKLVELEKEIKSTKVDETFSLAIMLSCIADPETIAEGDDIYEFIKNKLERYELLDNDKLDLFKCTSFASRLNKLISKENFITDTKNFMALISANKKPYEPKNLTFYQDYFSIRYNRSCSFQKYLLYSDDIFNIKWHRLNYEEYGSIDDFEDEEVTWSGNCDSNIYALYGLCSNHSNFFTPYSHYYKQDFLTSMNSDFIKNFESKLELDVIDVVKTKCPDLDMTWTYEEVKQNCIDKTKKVPSRFIDFLAKYDVPVLSSCIKNNLFSFADENVDLESIKTIFYDFRKCPEPLGLCLTGLEIDNSEYSDEEQEEEYEETRLEDSSQESEDECEDECEDEYEEECEEECEEEYK
jgi:hypothetical protein